MKKIMLIAKSLLLIASSHAQTESFDIASFTAPPGWQRIDSNGKLGFFDAKTTNGMTSFCQIVLFPSRASSGNAMMDFNDEWKLRIVPSTGYTQKPKTKTGKSPDGWDTITGYTNVTQQGATYTCMLTTISGEGKLMSVLVNIAGQDYVPVVENFFKSLQLNTTANTNPPLNNGSGALSNYIYTPPPGWTSTQYPDGIVLSTASTSEKCNITLWPMRGSTGNIQNDANNLFAEVFKQFEPRNSETQASDIKGISAQGWEHYIIKKPIGLRGGDFQTMFGFVFVANLGKEVAAISGISKDPLVSSCFGLLQSDLWPGFFYSLQFKNWARQKENPLLKKIPGVWITATATASDRFAFASNGRFAGAAAAQKYIRVSGSELLRVTDAYFGDGSYSINGNSIILRHDSEKNHPETGMLRIEQESKDGGRTWTEKLYLLRKSIVDGSIYEAAYDKQD